MNILRKLSLALLAALLSASLLTLASAHVGIATIHNHDTVKGWFDKSDFYNKVTDVVLDNAKKGNDTTNDIPVKDPQVQAVAKQAFTPDFIKSSINAVLDGTYSYLDGSTKNLNFSIDIADAKQRLGTGIAAYVTTRVSALPICTANDLNQDFDGYTATCRPSFITAEQAGQAASDKLLSQDILKNATITAGSIKVGGWNGGPSTTLAGDAKQVTFVRSAYQKSTQLPVILALISAALAAGIVFVSSNRMKGIRRAGTVFITSGALLLVIYIALGVVFTAATKKAGASDMSKIQTTLMLDFVKAILDSAKRVLLWYALGYILLGITGVILGSVLGKEVREKTILDEEPIALPLHGDLSPVTDEEKILAKPAKDTKKNRES